MLNSHLLFSEAYNSFDGSQTSTYFTHDRTIDYQTLLISEEPLVPDITYSIGYGLVKNIEFILL